jgi:putative iron-dependent peroxidase
MESPQTGIFALGTSSHAYLELDAVEGGDLRALVGAVANLSEPRTTIGGVNLVVGFRPELWASVAPGDAPPGLTGFDASLVGPDGYTVTAAQHDVVAWIAGAAYDVVFDASRAILGALAATATLAQETVGWQYHRDLDLTGFIDGIENPPVVEAASDVVVSSGPGAGGSVLLLQLWEHDAAAWESLSVQAQEAVMGRRKAGGEELDPRPETSHVGRTDQDRFGKIFRRNIAYGSLAHHGTVFVGFARDRQRLDAMLRSMLGLDGPADALIAFARPLSSAYYFVPSADALVRVGGR